MANQTTRRREGGVGRWVLAVRLEKRQLSFRLPQRRDRLFPYIEHPSDNFRAVFRYFHRPRGGGLNMEMGTTHHQTRWGVGIERSMDKWHSHWLNVFLPTSCLVLYIRGTWTRSSRGLRKVKAYTIYFAQFQWAKFNLYFSRAFRIEINFFQGPLLSTNLCILPLSLCELQNATRYG